MNFNIYYGKTSPLGHLLEAEHFSVFFGNRQSNLETLIKEFSQFTFCSLKQVHGNTIASSMLQEQQADAHYGTQKNFALAIQTADCMPVMVFDPRSLTIAGIHAGWRGVENKIVPKTLKTISASKETLVFIGPHITKDSFAVDKDVADLFPEKYVIYNPLDQKYYVDLEATVKEQIFACGIPNKNIASIYTNTFANEEYCSFRRQKQKGLRQYSFIALT